MTTPTTYVIDDDIDCNTLVEYQRKKQSRGDEKPVSAYNLLTLLFVAKNKRLLPQGTWQQVTAEERTRLNDIGQNFMNLKFISRAEAAWPKMRPRVYEICIGLQALGLSALEILAIIDHTDDDSELVPMCKKWDAIVGIKHFHEHQKTAAPIPIASN